MDVYGKIWNERRMVIRERVLEEVPPGAELEDETLQAMIDRTITELFPDEYIRLEEKRKLRHMVFNSIRRMDVLQDVLEDETITEIMVNGPHHIFVEQAGRLYETGLSFEHQTRLENIVQQIASRIDIMIHLGRLRDKSRRVLEISEVGSVVDGKIELHPLFIFEEQGEMNGRVKGHLVRTKTVFSATGKAERAGVIL